MLLDPDDPPVAPEGDVLEPALPLLPEDGLEDEPLLPMPELDEPDWRFVASLEDPLDEPDMPPEDDEPEDAPVPAPRLESPPCSQPYRPPTAIARGSRKNADFLSMNELL